MTIQSAQLISDLTALTLENLNTVQSFQLRQEEELAQRAATESWSVLECIEHLNRYGNFYLPEIEKRINNSTTHSETLFKSGVLGNYFAKMMLPEKAKKMKTFNDMNPLNFDLDKRVLDQFINQQYQLLELLKRSGAVSLNKVKTNISISKWITLKLGDVLRIVIYHNQRHIKQAEKTLNIFVQNRIV
jgi:hypothetical protein